MTLIGFEENAQQQQNQQQQDQKPFAMLSVPGQQSANFYHHQTQSHHHNNRGNVIVSGSEQNQNLPPQQGNQSGRPGGKRRAYGAANPPYGVVQPASVARRNARERNRVKQVKNGFATLRQHIPQSLAAALGGNTAGTQGGARAGNKKLSKVETLRMAVEYIRNLQSLLEQQQESKKQAVASHTVVSPKQEPIDPELDCAGYTTTSDLGSPMSGDDENNPHYHYQLHYQQQQPHHHHHHQQLVHQDDGLSPNYAQMGPLSDASSSPTPSYNSETSSGSQGGFEVYTPLIESYENYPPVSDDEVLNAISASCWSY